MQDNELYHSLISKVAFTLGQNLLVNGRFLLKFFFIYQMAKSTAYYAAS